MSMRVKNSRCSIFYKFIQGI